jgi:uncharacterized protein
MVPAATPRAESFRKVLASGRIRQRIEPFLSVLQKIQRQKKASHTRMGLIIRSSAIHAAGCYTTTPIRKGARVAEYTGPRIAKEEADALYEDSTITYLFGLGDGSIVIDGHCAAMFINHSCDANCETSEEDDRVWVTAIKNIPAGAEITYDYCLYDGGDDEAICNCGAKTCRGTMYSEEEIKSRRAAAKKAAKKPAKKKDGKRKAGKSAKLVHA